MLQNATKLLLQRASVRYYSAAPATARKPATKPAQQKQNFLITCKRTEFNLLKHAPADSKFKSIPLASGSWLHHKSKNDKFIIHPTVSEEDIRAEMQDVDEFVKESGLQFSPELLRNLEEELDIEELTAIQSLGIPKIYDSHHTLIAAETGCGKTLTYLLPIVQKIIELKRNPNASVHERKMNTPLAVIITPGRELATQIGQVAEELCDSLDVQIKTILGGNTKRLMMDPEFGDVDILVASMGALSKLVTTGIYRMGQVRHVVLDEADTLLDDSFAEKLGYFLKKFPFHSNHTQDHKNVGTQLVLASATMPTNIGESLQRIIDIQTLQQVTSPHLHHLMPHVEQRFLRLPKIVRPAKLLQIVKDDVAKKRPLIIFSNKSATSDFVDIFLNKNGVRSVNLNGDMLMKIRMGRFEQYQNGEYDVLSTTDVASRGLDTTRARHVVNFDFPLHVSDYIHRCGRIGRVSNLQKCLVTNLISSRREIDVVQRIEHAARVGGLLPNVNANIKNLINKRIMADMKAAGIPLPPADETAMPF